MVLGWVKPVWTCLEKSQLKDIYNWRTFNRTGKGLIHFHDLKLWVMSDTVLLLSCLQTVRLLTASRRFYEIYVTKTSTIQHQNICCEITQRHSEPSTAFALWLLETNYEYWEVKAWFKIDKNRAKGKTDAAYANYF